MPDDKFIFVNAPTIINAGPRDARRQLRSQLMRRVYLKKYQVTPSPTEDDVVSVDGKESVGHLEKCRCEESPVDTVVTPPDDDHNEKSPTIRRQKVLKFRSPPERKLPTPPIDDEDELDTCANCGGVCHVSKQSSTNARRKTPNKCAARTKKQATNGDPKMAIGSSSINPFEPTFNDKKDFPNSNVLIQHYSQILIPMLRSGPEWRRNCFSEYVQIKLDPLLFHTLCLSSSVHLDKLMLWNGVEADRRRREFEQSHYRYTCLRELRRVLAKPKVGTPEFDAILISICLLSVSDPMGELPPSVNKMDYNPFSHALQSLGGLNVYGYQPVHPVHWKGLLTLIEQHGGFDKIQLYAAKWKISYTAIKYALHTCTQPAFPICNHAGDSLTQRTPLEILGLSPSSLPRNTGTGFMRLRMFSIRDSIQQTFVEVGQVAQSMHIMIPQRDDTVVRDLVADARNLVQYRFQQLPLLTDDPFTILDISTLEESSKKDISSVVELAYTIYKMCWLVGYLFTTHVTFPVPSSRRFRLERVFEVRDAVRNCGYALQQDPWILKLQLWCVVISGIAAEDIDADLRHWMALKAGDLCARLGLRDWEQVVNVMNSFAWMETACAHGASKFWAEVQNPYD